MPIAAVTWSRLFPVLPCFAVLSVTGCVIGSTDDPGLALAIKQHYAAHATEEEGACRNPKIDTIQEHRLLEKSADGEDVMMVRYSYFDPSADMDADWSKLVYLSQPCGGIAERQFVLSKDDLGYRVIDMGGERHDAESTR
jgi:hypothetical protein